jgi:hypothetical protein
LLFAHVMPFVARAGLFGPALQRKTIEQEATNLPVLLAGRTEPPMTITAIMQRPLLGWGSAEKMPPDSYAQAEHLAVRMGYAPTFPFDIYWPFARRRLLRRALDPAGFLGGRRLAGRAFTGVAVGGLHRRRVEQHTVRDMGSPRTDRCAPRDLGSAIRTVDIQYGR